MKITFLGAAQTVTGSMHLLEVNGARILLDCGLFQGRRQEAFDRNRNLPFDARRLDAMILSHAHIDHSGNIPNLVASGFKGRIYATRATRDLCSAMLLDSGHIQESDVTYVNKVRRRKGLTPVEPIYTVAEARTSLKQLFSVEYRQPFDVAPGVQATLFDAGHILGSAITALDVQDGVPERSYRLCFSGDLGRHHLPVLRDPEVVRDVDYLMIESTYGNRLHDTPTRATDQLCAAVRQTYDRGGKVIIPAFAVGRTQDIIYDLHQLIEGGSLPSLPVYVDSPLALNVTKIFRQHPECYDQEMQGLLKRDDDPFGFYRLQYTRSVDESKALNRLKGPAIIVSASGMCEGGRVLHHLKNNVGDARNTILFVGFQAPNTLGRKIVDGLKQVPIFGEPYDVRAEVRTIDGYSAHADRNELLAYVRQVVNASQMKRVFCIHGDPEACQSLAEGIRGLAENARRGSGLGVADVQVPELGQEVDL